jgi:2-dehydro-3-deoxyphosphogluconate aldolase/(4S)-4-hydroxy-2-oxoglutarate aldolase
MEDIASILKQAAVIPVLTIERLEDAAPLGRALSAGGLTVLEVTLRTEAACESIRRLKAELPEARIGAGTVLNLHDLERAQEAGADFFVSPGSHQALLSAASEQGLAWLPGVATASEMMRGLEAGFTHFKFFPAEQLGGVAALKSFAGPLPLCRFCPTGGVTLENAANYLALPNVVCVGGSWIATPELMAAGQWAAITDRAAAAHRLGASRA